MPSPTNTATSTRAFCIANHRSVTITDVTEPWSPEFQKPIPDFGTKAQYRAWCAAETTSHNFLSMIEAENPARRCGGDNPPFRIHGVVADYDADVTEAEIAAGIARQNYDHPVFAFNRTFSGGVRVVWRFAEPVFYTNKDAFLKFMARLKRELHIGDLFPGLDDDAFNDPFKTYTGGDGWTVQGGIVRPEAVQLWLLEATSKLDWSEFGPNKIPLELVKAEIDKKFGPHSWEGEFAPGARGKRFWEPGADATSVIVRETGLSCFTGDKPFISWGDLLGKQFISAYMESRAGAAIRDMYFDGRQYWRQLKDGDFWQPLSVEMARRHLQVQYGLEAKVPKGENFSEIDQVLHRLETSKFIAAALPFPCDPRSVVDFNGKRMLNISNIRVMSPCLDPVQWGADFPFVSGYLSQLFLHEDTLTHILAWIRHAYKHALEGDPARGQALFIAGPPGTGKTLFSRLFLACIFGGCADASAHLVGGERFNDALFENYIWAIDDSHAANDPRAHARYSTAVKAVVANPTMPYARKYGAEIDCPFNGRLVVTLNDDAMSLEMLPNLELSLQEKVMIVRTGDLPVDLPFRGRDLEALIKSELPAFLRWLLDWTPPADIVGEEGRFGYLPHQDIGLVEDAREDSSIGVIDEVVDTFRQVYKKMHPELTEWAGPTTELLSLLKTLPETTYVCPNTPDQLGRRLRQAMGQGMKGIQQKKVRFEHGPRRVWVVTL